MPSFRTPAHHWASVVPLALAAFTVALLDAHQVPPPPEGAPTTPALTRLLADRDVENVSGGYQYAEGPLWHPDGYLLFADSPRDRILKWDPAAKAVTVFREPSSGATALGFDAEGRLLATEHRNRRISRTERDGSIVTLVDRFEDKRLNSPNDFVVSRTGSVFFTEWLITLNWLGSTVTTRDTCGLTASWNSRVLPVTSTAISSLGRSFFTNRGRSSSFQSLK